MRGAGIDIGSNSLRLLVADVTGDGLHVLARELVTVKLGRGLTNDGVLAPTAVRRAFSTLAAFREIISHHQPQSVRACATAALRQAAERDVFLAQAHDLLGVQVEIITGWEEAELATLGALARLQTTGCTSLLLADVGGGSTELAFLESHEAKWPHPVLDNKKLPPLRTVSINMGAGSLTETFLKNPLPTSKEINDLGNSIKGQLDAALKAIAPPRDGSPPLVIGSGGTATALAGLDLGLARYDHDLVQNYQLTATNMDRLWNQLTTMPVAERNLLPGLDQGRGEILPAGTRIYQVLLELLAADSLQVSDAGLVEGILLSCINTTRPWQNP